MLGNWSAWIITIYSACILRMPKFVTKEDTIPQKACIKCLLNLKLAFQIQQKFLHSYKWLTEHLSEMGDTKPDITSTLCMSKGISKEADVDIANKSEDGPTNEKDVCDVKVEDESSCEADPSKNEQLEKTEGVVDSANEAISREPTSMDTTDETQHANVPEIVISENARKASDVPSFLDTISLGKCVICGLKDATTKHVRGHYDLRYKCEYCYVFLGNIKEYGKHMADNHKQMDMVCPSCGLSFRYACLYNLHRANAHVNPKNRLRNRRVTADEVNDIEKHKVHDCKECGKCFFTEAKFLTHIKIHQRVKCPICEREVGRQNYYTHYKMHSASQLVCHLCGAVVKNISSFRGHLYYTHSQRSLPCEHCGKVFKKKYALTLHTKKEHTGERNHVCEVCGKRFVTGHRLNKHTEMKHLKLRKHVCRFCNKALSSKHALKTHERQHTNDNPYKCEVCGEGFRQNVSLRWHRKSKHNIVEEKKVECKECGKMFETEWAVKSHARVHM
ncbi:unnamed protein product [Acanthoscelides obtectus]|uniref:C2H2-type domain-containing protein n=1 Tax=Acanthoscelides obtectus TaxID=200917 RepID=A0A9P0KNB0_ACAOB|nr:unnamed protein product [Acanthoscelides obtectus]CAK1620664.1 Zinc finger protein 497 [Acanthoscelides obtectus]